MRKTGHLTLYHLRENWGLRALVFLLIIPLTIFFLRGLPLLNEEDLQVFTQFSISLVEEDQSMLSQLIKDQLSEIEILEQVHLDTRQEAGERLAADEILLIVIIPTGFLEQTMAALPREALEVVLNPNMPTETAMFVQFINDLARSITSIQAAYFAYTDLAKDLYEESDIYYKMLEATFLRLFLKALGRHAAVEQGQVLHFKKEVFVLSSLLCILTLLLALLNFLIVQQEKKSNILERQLAAGISWWEQLLARQLASTIWLLAGMAPVLGLIARLFPQFQPAQAVLAICLLYWTASALAQAYSLFGTASESKIIGAWLLAFFFLLLGGLIYPLQLLPEWLIPFSRLSPAYWAGSLIEQSLGGPLAASGQLPAWVFILSLSTFFVYLVSRHNEGRKPPWRKSPP